LGKFAVRYPRYLGYHGVIKKLTHHIFVCTNERPSGHPRGCCHARGAEDLVKLFKEAVSSAGLSAEVRAQKAGCLDVCEQGPAVVIYPDNLWYGHVTPSDVSEIVRAMQEGKPLERLLIAGKIS
jgi:(2Fe-2S) ferredoxin